MKILLVSDSHGDVNTLKDLVNKHNDCDLYLHAGDSEVPKELISPFASIRGNCDYYSYNYPNDKYIETPFGKLYMEHIPFNLKSVEKLKKENVRVYIHGHTHRKRHEIIDDIYVINPGSINYPRDGAKSYAIIELDQNNLEVRFKKI